MKRRRRQVKVQTARPWLAADRLIHPRDGDQEPSTCLSGAKGCLRWRSIPVTTDRRRPAGRGELCSHPLHRGARDESRDTPAPAGGPVSPQIRGSPSSGPACSFSAGERAPELGLHLCSGCSRQPARASPGEGLLWVPGPQMLPGCPGYSPHWPSTSPGQPDGRVHGTARLSRVSALPVTAPPLRT
ncbi:unnamed protein product [Rangifer tarandus platyrhynchus]|uniref:Uncharacterized protein n=1 Tax=Rangifer tarandus platyrhynchus TaxID=3082113 RepID=A0AC59ZH64_RANTA